jgi:hypothetical protein
VIAVALLWVTDTCELQMASKRNPAPTTSGRPEVYMKTYGGKLEAALEILKNRYMRDFPAFLKALEVPQLAPLLESEREDSAIFSLFFLFLSVRGACARFCGRLSR